jgi:hypothetical protein
MDYLIYVFNLLLLLFWIRLWSAPAKEFYFNPFLSGTVKFTDSVLAFLRPVLYMPEQAAALVVMLFVILFKTILFARLNVPWNIRIGVYFQFAPAAAAGQVTPTLLFSVLHVAVFLVRLWTVYLLVWLITPPFRVTRATEALAFFARPFSWLPKLAQPPVLLALHLLLAFALARTGVLSVLGLPTEAPKPVAVSPFLEGPLTFQLLKTAWLAALSFADGLMLLTRGLFVLILCNLGAAVFQSRGLLVICNEGVELLLGRFARRGLGGMGFDFTPLIFFFVVDLMYNSICRGLFELIHSPFFK